MPDLRVTSTFNPEQTQELIESLKAEGQIEPVKLIYVEGKLVLADGLNRILALSEIGLSTVKALIKIGSITDVQIANIITARTRGRENPAQTAEVIRDLVDIQKQPLRDVLKRLGISTSWGQKLYSIAQLPDEIKDHVKYGRLAVSSAFHLTQLDNPTLQITIADQAANWRYTEDQVKAAVYQQLNPDVDLQQQPVVFQPDGRPTIVYPRCYGCKTELQAFVVPVNCCQSCYELINVFFQNYFGENSDPTLVTGAPGPRPQPTGGFVNE